MAKTITLKQLSEKKYTLVEGLTEEIKNTIGAIEDAFDVKIYGASGNGKSNFTAILLKALVLALNCKCEYVSYEEGHGKTFHDTMIQRQDMLNAIGNRMLLTDHLTYDELVKRMSKKQSAKIWVIDSIQAAGFNKHQCKQLREKFVLSRKKKIIIFIGWAEGKAPKDDVGKSVEYYAHIKLRVEGFIVFPKSRFGGNHPYVIWEGDERSGAIKYWGKEYWKITGKPKPVKPKKQKPISEPAKNEQHESESIPEVPG